MLPTEDLSGGAGVRMGLAQCPDELSLLLVDVLGGQPRRLRDDV